MQFRHTAAGPGSPARAALRRAALALALGVACAPTHAQETATLAPIVVTSGQHPPMLDTPVSTGSNPAGSGSVTATHRRSLVLRMVSVTVTRSPAL